MKNTAYLIQGTLVVLWWMGLLLSPRFYAAFEYEGISKVSFYAFMLPDILVIGVLSILRAYQEKEYLEYIVLGGFAFATLYCINASIVTYSGWLSTVVMLLGLFYNVFLVFQKDMFRVSKSTNFSLNACKTIVQILCVWLVTLVAFPVLILYAFGQSLLIVKGSVFWLGVVLFLLSSWLGLLSAYTIVKLGKGTPLPLDQTQDLVVAGVYKYVRNPMAIAGVGQGVAVSVIYQSIAVFVYALLGAILWQWVVRPAEEADLLRRFGLAYENYRQQVNCWFPKF